MRKATKKLIEYMLFGGLILGSILPIWFGAVSGYICFGASFLGIIGGCWHMYHYGCQSLGGI
jgi:hypothetical protein